MINPELVWMTPVAVQLKDGTRQIFACVNDALDFLEGDWTIDRGRKFNRAAQSCRRALNRATPVAIARDAFIDACRDAGMSADTADLFDKQAGTGGQRSLA